MLENNYLVRIKNRFDGSVGYTIPDMSNLHRSFMPGEVKAITMEELRKLSYIPGGLRLLQDCLVILDEHARREIMNEVEPEYFLDESGIKDLLLNGSVDALLDCLDFAPAGVVSMLKKIAVEIELNDVKKRNAILEKTGFNVTKAIENRDVKTEADAAPVRRVVEENKEENTGRRTTTNYKITKIIE